MKIALVAGVIAVVSQSSAMGQTGRVRVTGDVAVAQMVEKHIELNSKTKTIQISDFPIRSSYVWGPMAPMFNNQLRDEFSAHTRLIHVKRNGDLKIEGEITQYQQRNKSVSADGYSAQTELSMTVNVRFTNNANHSEDFERTFTASQSYETTKTLNEVQEELVTQMCKDICDQIFNATVANW